MLYEKVNFQSVETQGHIFLYKTELTPVKTKENEGNQILIAS